MMQFFNFVMSALNDPLAAGTQMALEGVSPDMIGSAIKPESQQTLGMMMQPQQQPQQMQPQQMQEQPQQAVYQPQQQGSAAANVMQVGGDNDLSSRFRNALMAGNPDRGVKGLTNPNAIAAVMSTGQHESGWSPTNVYGTWSDPSVSGEAGTSGGALSWRAERLSNLLSYAGTDKPPEIEMQASFFLEENPQLIRQLEAAETPEQAQMLMNNAWRFAGYDQSGGEAADRINTARTLVGTTGAPMGQGGIGSDAVATQQASAESGRYTAQDYQSNTQEVMSASTDTGMGPGAADKPSRARTLADKIAQIGKGLKTPERQPVEGPRITGGLGPQVGGAYNPGELGEMFALLGGKGQPQLPPLSQLIRGAQ